MTSNTSQHSNRQKNNKKPPIPHCRYKDSAAARLQAAFGQLCRLLHQEWASIRSLNLGVKSGTGVINDVLYCQLQQLASTVHLLAVTDADASSALVSSASRLSTHQFQNLQVLLDGLGLEELSDFLRLMCCNPAQLHHTNNTSSSSSTSDHTSSKRPSSSATMAAGPAGATGPGADKAAATGGIVKSGRHTAPGVEEREAGQQEASTRIRRMRAAAGAFELSRASFSDAAPSIQQLVQQQQQQQQRRGAGGGLGLHSSGFGSMQLSHDAGLRFAHLLPAGHILVKTAQALQQQQEFQAALAAAAATPRPPRRRAGVPLLQLPIQDGDGAALALGGHVYTDAEHQHQQQQEQQHQQELGIQCSTAYCGPSSSNNSSSSPQQPPPPAQQQQQLLHPHAGPWRGSWLGGMVEPGGLAVDALHTPGLVGLDTRDGVPRQQQQQHHHVGNSGLHPGACVLSTHGCAHGRAFGFTGLQGQQQVFKAPTTSIEQLWKAGRAATTAAVLSAARLPVHDSAGDALSLLLAPGLVVVQQQRVQQRDALRGPQRGSSMNEGAAAAAAGGGGRSRLTSRRASAVGGSSRPVSARNPRQAACSPGQLPPLQLHKARPGSSGSSSSSSRPGSAAVSSRLGGAVTHRSLMQEGTIAEN